MEVFLIKYGLLAVFLAAMVEADVIPVLTGVIAHLGYVRPTSAFLIVSAGALVGDCIWFCAGRYFSATIRNGRFFRRIRQKAERLTRQLGIWQIPASHIVYGTRIGTMVFWGSHGLSWSKFALVDTLGCVFFTALFFTLGFAFSGSAGFIIGGIKRVEFLMLAAVVLFGTGFYLLNKLFQRQFQRAGTSGVASEQR